MHTIRQATIDDAEAIDHIWRQRLDEDGCIATEDTESTKSSR